MHKDKVASRLVLVAAAVSFASFAADGQIGPCANPEDQFRAFSLFPSRYYEEISAMGVNTFLQLQMYDNFDGRTKAERQASLHAMLDRIHSDGGIYLHRNDAVCDLDLRSRYPRIGKDGSPVRKRGNILDASNPAPREELRRMLRENMEFTGRNPAFAGIMVASEVRDATRVSFTPFMSNDWAKASGGKPIPAGVDARVGPRFSSIKDFPKGRIVPEDYPLLEFYRWFWRKGDGWNDCFNESIEVADSFLGKKALTYYSPSVRCPPLWGADSGNVDIQATWLYANPLPYANSYGISELQEMAKGRPGAMTLIQIQGICYRSRVAPKDVKVENEPAWVRERPNALYVTIPPDLAAEAFWWAFARRVDGIGIYGWRSLFDSVPAGFATTAIDYQYTNHESVPRIAELFRRVAVPLGPLFRAVPERQPEVAILESSAATFFAGRGCWGGGGDGYIFMTGMAATKANLMPHAMYDDDIRANGIPDTVKVILMPHCDVLTETTYDAIKKFQKRGGIVLGDKVLVPGIAPDGWIGGSFPSFWDCTAQAIADGVAKAADAMVEVISPRYRRYATADNPDILLHVRTFGSADYLFAINDRRTAGDYVGQWGKCFEKGLPNRGTVTVNRATGAVYDLVAHRAVPFTSANGKTEIPVEYATTDGRLLLLVRTPLSPLSARNVGGELVVTTPDIDVMIPIVLETPGEKPFYAVVKNGLWRKSGVPVNAQVRSLADGSVAKPLVVARPAEIESRYREWTISGIDPLVPASRSVAKPRKVPLSLDPANDHDIIKVKTIKIDGESFVLPPRGKSAAVEAWLGLPDRDFSLKVNGKDAGEYRRILDTHAESVRFDLTPFVDWDGRNTLEFADSEGAKWQPKGTIEVLEIGN